MSVNIDHGISEGVVLNAQDLYNLYRGNPAVLTASRSYLRHTGPSASTNELTKEFNWRKSWTPFLNYQKKIVGTFLGYMFFNPPEVEIIGGGEDKDDRIKMYTIDFSRRASLHAFIAKQCYIYVDTEPRIYTMLQVDSTNDAKGIYIILPGTDNEIRIDINKMTRRGTDKKTGKRKSVKLKPGQFEVVAWDDIPTSLIADTAPLNLQIYNMMSVLDAHVIRSLVYWIFGPSLDKDKLAAYEYLGLNDPKVTAKLLKPGTEDIAALMAIIKGLILQMGVMVGLEEEFGGEIFAGDSALAVETRMLDTNALLTTAAFNIGQSVNRSMEYYASIGGKAGTITIKPRLKVLAKKEVLANIDTIINDFGISKGTKAWAELVKLGVVTALSQDLTPNAMRITLKSIDDEQHNEQPFSHDVPGDEHAKLSAGGDDLGENSEGSPVEPSASAEKK